jgi:hypothetical protein
MGDHNGLRNNYQGNDSYSLVTGTNEGCKYQPDMDSNHRRFPAGVLGHHYMANPPVEIMDIPRDRATSPESKKKLKLIGGVAASLALTFALVGTACSKLSAGAVRVNNRPVPVEQSANTPADSSNATTAEPKQETDPNMNTETADSEHDGKISYEIYEYDPKIHMQYNLIGERTSQVDYAPDDTVDDRKEMSMADLTDFIAKRNEQDPTGTKFVSIGDVFAKGEDYHGRNAFADMVKQYGGYKDFKFKVADYVMSSDGGIQITQKAQYHCQKLADANPYITDGIIKVTIFNPNNDSSDAKEYGGRYVIEIPALLDKKETNDMYGLPVYGGRIVCDHMPTEKELIQIIKDNYSTLFKTENEQSGTSSFYVSNQKVLDRIKAKQQKP